jgi:hypothetical protein
VTSSVSGWNFCGGPIWYGHSGLAQLALALLLEITAEEMARLWYQDVRSHVLARLALDDFVIDSQEVVDCIVSEVKPEFMLKEQAIGRKIHGK